MSFLEPRILRRLRLAATLLVVLGTTPALALGPWDHPNQPHTPVPEMPSTGGEGGGVDTISPYTGSLNLSIPIGQYFHVGGNFGYQIAIHYTSNIWRFREGSEPGQQNFVEATLDPADYNVGTGWIVGFGRLLAPQTAPNPSTSYVYISPSGSRHRFFQQLHQGENDGNAAVLYSRDNSYLRLNVATVSAPTIEFPNGDKHIFSGNASAGWRATRWEDRFGNGLNISYGTNVWNLSDSHGRQHVINFANQGGGRGTHVSSIKVAAFGANSTDATYSFNYDLTSIRRTCLDTRSSNNGAGGEEAMLNVALLKLITGPTEIEAPKRIKWDMQTSGGAAEYHRGAVRSSNQCTFAGVLESLENPMKGETTWDWQAWSFPATGKAYRDTSPGVHHRNVSNPHSAFDPQGTWTYSPELYPNAQNAEEVHTTVTMPGGHEEKFYFYAPQGEPIPWDYGLPIAKSAQTSDGMYLSRSVYDASAGLMRQVYVSYTKDSLNGLTGMDVLATNRRVFQSRTKYNDDMRQNTTPPLPHTVTTTLSDFDGFGHYRQADKSGTFELGSTWRREFTNWNDGRGCYSECSGGTIFSNYPPGSAWILSTFSRRRQQDDQASQWQRFTWNSTQVATIRVLEGSVPEHANDDVVGPHDVLIRYCYDGSGNVTTERWFGGDTQDLSTLDTSCASAQSRYRLQYGYSYGSRSSSAFTGPGGAGIGFNNWTATIDRNTGLAKSVCDSSNYCSDLTYDLAGRLLTQQGAGLGGDRAATVGYDYSYVSGTEGGWKVTAAISCPVNLNCSSEAAGYPEQHSFYDGLGRLYKVKRRNADGTWSKQVSQFFIQGWTKRVSEWASDGTADGSMPATVFDDFDVFGRPGDVIRADGKVIDLLYTGDRQRRRKVRIATSVTPGDPESDAQTIETYDIFGRLVKLAEPAGAGGALIDAQYFYGTGGQLGEIKHAGSVNQHRYWFYDRRGFLQYEQVPERGTTSENRLKFGNYDAMGRPGYQHIGSSGNGVTFERDWAGRLRFVREEGTSSVLKEFVYDTGAGRGLGKLAVAKSYNDFTYADYDHTLEVRETYEYSGIAGAPSKRTTLFLRDGVGQEQFATTLGLDRIGQVLTVGYPGCTGGSCGSPGPATRTVNYSYTRGFLTAVPGYLTSISYHENGVPNQTLHTNNMRVTQLIDTSSMIQRVKAINVLDVTTGTWLYPSGDYQYDGAGNIKAIGADRYAYDLVSRLVQANETRVAGGSTQTATYDAFGNLTSLLSNGSGPTMNVDASSNRLSSPTIEYDTWGNMSRWQSQFYQYDRLNRLKRFDNGTEHWIFAYAADDERAWIYRIGDGGYEMWTIRGVDGQVLREYRSNFLDGYRDYVRASGRVVAKVDRISASQGVVDQTIHFATDHLGTIRVSTRQDGYLETAHHYFPYGQRINPNPTEDERLQFTGHERDTWLTSGFADDLDYMHARHYNAQLGRFLQVDPRPGTARRPQSLNRFSYVSGNPVRLRDPWGLEEQDGSCPAGCTCDNGEVVICPGGGETINVVARPWFPWYQPPPPPGGGGDSFGGGQGPCREISDGLDNLLMYVLGNGHPHTYRFEKLEIEKTSVRTFPHFKDAVAEACSTGSCVSYDRTRTIRPEGFVNETTVGSITIRATGLITPHADGTWTFEGDLTALPDITDYNPSTHRDSFGELLTRAANLLPGTPFELQIIGSSRLSNSGACK
jgi:RHS repeat-associated protein